MEYPIMTYIDPEWHRHHTTRAGEDFRDAIWLDGYDGQSVWGYDTGVSSFFAQVWSNDSASYEPDLWLTPPDLCAAWPYVLVPLIVTFTGSTPLSVVRALGVARPAPELISDDALCSRRARCSADTGNPHAAGQARALDWVLGDSHRSPFDATPVNEAQRPTAAEVDAEAHHAAGMLTLLGGAELAGVEEALLRSLRRP